MKTVLKTVTFALLLVACKQPPATAVVPTASVAGTIFYRSACQLLGTPVPFTPPASGAGDVGPYLYLSDLDGKMVSTAVTTRLDGTFVIPKVPAGTYELRIRAQELRNFWLGAPVATIGVIVSATAAKGSATVQVGVACADNEQPTADAVLASWGDGVTMAATRGNTLHLEAASIETRLDVRGGDPDGDTVRAQFATLDGEIEPASALSAFWPHADGVTSDALRVLVTDGHGGNIALNLPVRLHQSRLLPLMSGGWNDLSDAATVASFEKLTFFAAGMTSSAGWVPHEAGLTARLEGLSTEPNFMFLYSPAPLTLTSMVVTEARFTVVQASTDWTAVVAFRSVDNEWLVGFQLRKDAAGYEWRFVDAGQNVLNSGLLDGFTGQQIALRLELDPVLGIANGRLRSEAGEITVSAVVGQMPAVQARALVIAGSMALDYETLELNFSGLYVATATHAYAFPSRPGTLGDQLYDQHPVMEQRGSFVVADQAASFGSVTITATVNRLAPMSLGLIRDFEGHRLTALTDMTKEEAIEMGLVIDSWDADAAFPLGGNRGILY